MTEHKSTGELKGLARVHMFGHYGPAIGMSMLKKLILLPISYIIAAIIPGGYIGNVIYFASYMLILAISGIFTAGITFFYLNAVSGNPVGVRMLFYGFKNCRDKALRIQLSYILRFVIVSVPAIATSFLLNSYYSPVMYLLVGISIVFMIVGIVYIALSFLPAFYILHDFPEYTHQEIMETSVKLMEGNKGRALYLAVGFIPLYLLGLCSFGVANLWVEPYVQASFAEFYMNLVRPEKE